MKVHKTVVIGSGQIAGGYDSPQDEMVLTHAHAIQKYPGFDLSGVFDINFSRAKAFAEKWDTKAYLELSDMFAQLQPEIAVICVPDEFHETTLQKLVSFDSLELVICEKPLGFDIDNLQKILEQYQKKDIQIAVNYSRNYDITLQQFKQDIEEKKYEGFINATFFYTKGILHNGSHAISLLRFLFGEVINVQILSETIDYKQSDPTLDLFIEFDNGYKCHMMAGNEQDYSLFNYDFYFQKARVKFRNNGFKVGYQEVEDDPVYEGYKQLGDVTFKDTHLKEALFYLYQNIADYLQNNQPLLCDAQNALKTQQTLDNIIKKHRLSKLVKQ